MKLSEAIRLGAMLYPQGFGDLWTDNDTKSCALGAAYDALGYRERANALPVAFAAFLDIPVRCPIDDMFLPVGEVITHLNDWHRWTRERIADWVETVETVEQATVEPIPLDAIDPVVQGGVQR